MSSRLEAFAINKFPKDGKCRKSCFANGNHRVGIIPISSILDGGLPGCSCIEICLECEKVFNKSRWFVVKDQPNSLT